MTAAQETTRKLWERQPWDTRVSYDRFHDFYLAQDLPRSLSEAYRRWGSRKGYKGGKGKGAPGTWQSWFRAQHKKSGQPIPGAIGWAERAAAWDDEARAKERKKWEDRIEEQRDRDWDMADALHKKAQQMLLFPLARTERRVEEQDGQTVQITEVHPARWRMRDAAPIAKIASDLARLAAKMETERKVLRVEDVLASIPAEWRDAVRQELAQFVWGASDTDGAQQSA